MAQSAQMMYTSLTKLLVARIWKSGLPLFSGQSASSRTSRTWWPEPVLCRPQDIAISNLASMRAARETLAPTVPLSVESRSNIKAVTPLSPREATSQSPCGAEGAKRWPFTHLDAPLHCSCKRGAVGWPNHGLRCSQRLFPCPTLKSHIFRAQARAPRAHGDQSQYFASRKIL